MYRSIRLGSYKRTPSAPMTPDKNKTSSNVDMRSQAPPFKNSIGRKSQGMSETVDDGLQKLFPRAHSNTAGPVKESQASSGERCGNAQLYSTRNSKFQTLVVG